MDFFSPVVLSFIRSTNSSKLHVRKMVRYAREGPRAFASHQCGAGSIPGVDAIYRLCLLLVLVFAPRVFLRVLRFSPLHKHKSQPSRKMPFVLGTFAYFTAFCAMHFQIPSSEGGSVRKQNTFTFLRYVIFVNRHITCPLN